MNCLEWLIENMEWVFSGIGVAVIGWFFTRKSGVKQSIKSGDDSINIQSGRDSKVDIGDRHARK